MLSNNLNSIITLSDKLEKTINELSLCPLVKYYILSCSHLEKIKKEKEYLYFKELFANTKNGLIIYLDNFLTDLDKIALINAFPLTKKGLRLNDSYCEFMPIDYTGFYNYYIDPDKPYIFFMKNYGDMITKFGVYENENYDSKCYSYLSNVRYLTIGNINACSKLSHLKKLHTLNISCNITYETDIKNITNIINNNKIEILKFEYCEISKELINHINKSNIKKIVFTYSEICESYPVIYEFLEIENITFTDHFPENLPISDKIKKIDINFYDNNDRRHTPSIMKKIKLHDEINYNFDLTIYINNTRWKKKYNEIFNNNLQNYIITDSYTGVIYSKK